MHTGGTATLHNEGIERQPSCGIKADNELSNIQRLNNAFLIRAHTRIFNRMCNILLEEIRNYIHVQNVICIIGDLVLLNGKHTP